MEKTKYFYSPADKGTRAAIYVFPSERKSGYMVNENGRGVLDWSLEEMLPAHWDDHLPPENFSRTKAIRMFPSQKRYFPR